MPGEAKLPNPDDPKFKEKCRSLKRKLRFLLYEQECFQEELRRNQRKLLKVSRDKNFLLERLLRYERVVFSGSDSESTESSEDEKEKEPSKKMNQQVGAAEKCEKAEKTGKVKKRPKRKQSRKLQTVPSSDHSVKKVLPMKLQTPPNTLKQQMPQLVEMLNRASSATNADVSSAGPFEGLPYTPAFAFPTLPHTSNLVPQLKHGSPPGPVLPSLLLAQQQFPHAGMMRELAQNRAASKPPSRKRAKKNLTEKLRFNPDASSLPPTSSQPSVNAPSTSGTTTNTPTPSVDQLLQPTKQADTPAEKPSSNQ